MGNVIALRADRLRALREKRGWSQRELARQSGVALAAVSKYERGEVDPSSTALKQMAERLEVSADYLLGLTNDPHGCIDTGDLTDDERAVLYALRRDSWPGVLRVATDHIAG